MSATSATLNGTVAANGNTIVSQGFQWKAIEEDTYTTINASGETMTYNLSGLTANTGYTYRAFATTSPTDTVYGAEETFTTTDGSIPCTPPSFTTCEFDHTVTVLLDDNNVSTCDWGDDSQSTTTDLYLMENGKYTLKHTYTNTGSYTLTVSYGGCSATSSVTIAKPTTLHPCTGTAHNSSVYQQNGYNGEFDDGFEVAINGGIISVEDYDGNVYSVTEINGQCWLAENLRCTHSPKTGNNIVITGDVASFTSKAAYWYNNMESMFSTKNFGLLYNWCAAMDTARPTNYIEVPTVTTDFFDAWVCSPSTPYHRGICPKGWHLPSKDEIDAMLTYILDDPSYKETGGGQLSYYQTAAKLAVGCDWKLSDECNGYFSSEQEVSCESTAVPGNLSYPDRNIYGFNAIPAGYYQGENDFSGYAEYSFFWSCTPDSDWLAWYFRISDYNNCETFINKDRAKEYGMSVRCVRDAE